MRPAKNLRRRWAKLPRLGENEMLDPIVPYSTAKGYVQSAFALMSSPGRLQANDTPFYASFHLLCGFAAELYLKAFLAHTGSSERELSVPNLRHDLHNLYDLALSRGLNVEGAKWLVDSLGKHHKAFEFRYMKRELEYTAVNIQGAFRAFSSLDVEVDTAVGASASLGKRPSPGWNFPMEYSGWRFPTAG
jgi:hypothetical protein